MNTEWENQKPPQALIKSIQDQLTKNENGTVSEKIGVDFAIDALLGAVKHDYKVDPEIVFDFFKESVIESFKTSQLKDYKLILDRFDEKHKEHIKADHYFILVTSINLKNQTLKRRSINNCKISFSKNIPEKYRKDRLALSKLNPNLEFKESDGYTFVTVALKAPDEKTAFKKAIDALDILRSILQIGFRKSINFLASSPKGMYLTDSVISLGYFHTLHFKNGKKACDLLWYEESFRDQPPTSIKNIEVAEKEISYNLKKIRNSPFEEHITSILKSYISALDVGNQDHRYMKLWATAEKLIKSDNTKIIVKRISFFYENRSLESQILNSLRKSRNITAHSGISLYNIEIKNYRLCMYLEHIIKFFISNPFRYRNLSKLLDFISLPTEALTIDEQIRNLKTVKKFIGD